MCYCYYNSCNEEGEKPERLSTSAAPRAGKPPLPELPRQGECWLCDFLRAFGSHLPGLRCSARLTSVQREDLEETAQQTLVCWLQSETWKFTEMHKQMFYLGRLMEPSLHQGRRLFSEAQEGCARLGLLVCFFSSSRLPHWLWSICPQHGADFKKSKTSPLASGLGGSRGETPQCCRQEPGEAATDRKEECGRYTREDGAASGGEAMFRNREGWARESSPGKHPPALGFYPLAWLLTRQELPRSGHRLL